MPKHQLAALQRGLEAIYRLDPAPTVDGFLMAPTPPKREEVYVIEEEDFFLGLGLDPNAINRLTDPLLAHDNLEEFCLAVEGVSHFLCLIHRKRQERTVSFLELELQAEVDKYVAIFMLTHRCPTLDPNRIRQQLYQQICWLEILSDEELDRYQQANDLALQYTHALEQKYIRSSQLTQMLTELRHFYRLDLWGKRNWIRQHLKAT